MYWIFNQQQAQEAVQEYSANRHLPANEPNAMKKLLNDFLNSDEFKKRDMMRGEDRDTA